MSSYRLNLKNFFIQVLDLLREFSLSSKDRWKTKKKKKSVSKNRPNCLNTHASSVERNYRKPFVAAEEATESLDA
jgi:hypothetical protein